MDEYVGEWIFKNDHFQHGNRGGHLSQSTSNALMSTIRHAVE